MGSEEGEGGGEITGSNVGPLHPRHLAHDRQAIWADRQKAALPNFKRSLAQFRGDTASHLFEILH